MKDIESRAKERALIDCGTIVAGIGDVSKARFNWVMNIDECHVCAPVAQDGARNTNGSGKGLYLPRHGHGHIPELTRDNLKGFLTARVSVTR